jgi:hypothetical protein
MQILLFSLIVLVTMALLLTNALRPEIIGLGVLFTLGATGLVSWKEAFAGFSSNAVMAMLACSSSGGRCSAAALPVGSATGSSASPEGTNLP